MQLLSPMPTTIKWKIKVFFIFLLWLLYPLKTKRSWRKCLYGAIPHKCEFEKPKKWDGIAVTTIRSCKHYGCNIGRPYFYLHRHLN